MSNQKYIEQCEVYIEELRTENRELKENVESLKKQLKKAQKKAEQERSLAEHVLLCQGSLVDTLYYLKNRCEDLTPENVKSIAKEALDALQKV